MHSLLRYREKLRGLERDAVGASMLIVSHTVDGVVKIFDCHGVARRTGHIMHGSIVAGVQEPFQRIVLSRCNRPYVMRVLGLSRSFDHLMALIIRLIDQTGLVRFIITINFLSFRRSV